MSIDRCRSYSAISFICNHTIAQNYALGSSTYLEGEEKRIALSRATAGTINGSERLVAANARVGDLSRACVAKTGALSQDPEFS